MSLDTNLQSAFTAVGTAVKGKISSTEKGQPNGVATLDGGGKIPSAQLPSYVDDVVEYTNQASFPVTGSTGIIYIALDNNTMFRWSGSVYISLGLAGGSLVESVAGRTGNVVLSISDITNLQTTLDGKAGSSHSHAISDITGLQTTLDSKASSSHSHAISDITGLQTTLDGKASTSSVSTLSSNVGATDTNFVTVFNAALV
jgi:hypothetical protein